MSSVRSLSRETDLYGCHSLSGIDWLAAVRQLPEGERRIIGGRAPTQRTAALAVRAADRAPPSLARSTARLQGNASLIGLVGKGLVILIFQGRNIISSV